MKKTLLSIGLVLGAFYSQVASAAIYTETEVNTHVVLMALSDKFNATKQDGGEFIVIDNDGCKATCAIDKKKKLIYVRIGFSDVSKDKDKLLKLCNRYNDEKVVARCCVDKDGDISIDTFLSYEGGLNTANLISHVEWLYSIESSFVKDYNAL